ncbi:hypothetical protein ACWGRS_19030 [Cellulosimicrobium funkei]|uniref:hypothetical protein n=1 Tax=Cellulosimicrobium funkei TaxID=264251 RepID=UPI003413B75C
MNDEERERVVDALAKRKHRTGEVLRGSGIGADELAELSALADTSELLWLSQHEAPPLEADPVAAMLGLVPDQQCTLDSKAFARARKKAGLKPSGIASRLRQRGWQTSDADVFRWETRTAHDVPPALVQALAEILGRTVEQLSLGTSDTPEAGLLEELRRSPKFKELVARWARARHVSLPVASATLQGRLVATVHRGNAPDTAQMLDSLDALVAAVEPPPE